MEQERPPPCEFSGKEPGLLFCPIIFWPCSASLAAVYSFPSSVSDKNVLCIGVWIICKAHRSIQSSFMYVVLFDPHKKWERELKWVYCPLCVLGKWTSRELNWLPGVIDLRARGRFFQLSGLSHCKRVRTSHPLQSYHHQWWCWSHGHHHPVPWFHRELLIFKEDSLPTCFGESKKGVLGRGPWWGNTGQLKIKFGLKGLEASLAF